MTTEETRVLNAKGTDATSRRDDSPTLSSEVSPLLADKESARSRRRRKSRERARARRSRFIAAWSGLIGADNSIDLYRARLTRASGVVSLFLAAITFVAFRIAAPLLGSDYAGPAGFAVLIFLVIEIVWLAMTIINVSRGSVSILLIRRRIVHDMRRTNSQPESRLDLRSPARFVAWCEKEHFSPSRLSSGGAQKSAPRTRTP